MEPQGANGNLGRPMDMDLGNLGERMVLGNLMGNLAKRIYLDTLPRGKLKREKPFSKGVEWPTFL